MDQIKSMLPQSPADPRDDASDRFLARDGDTLLTALSTPVTVSIPRLGHQGAVSLNLAAGGAAGLGDVFVGMRAAAWRLLNYATYYQMKERAGIVGSGLNKTLGRLRQMSPRLGRLHFVGHSFGARVVTAAIDGNVPLLPSSLTLLQGAFSHNGFASRFDGANDGFFRKVVSSQKVKGPVPGHVHGSRRGRWRRLPTCVPHRGRQSSDAGRRK